MMSHCNGAKSSFPGIMLSLEFGWTVSSSSVRRESTSALVFLVPGQYVTVNRNLVKNKDHLPCRGFKCLAERRYSRFL